MGRYDNIIYHILFNMGIIWVCLKMAYNHVLNNNINIYIYIYLNIKECRVHLQETRETSDSWDESIIISIYSDIINDNSSFFNPTNIPIVAIMRLVKVTLTL